MFVGDGPADDAVELRGVDGLRRGDVRCDDEQRGGY